MTDPLDKFEQTLLSTVDPTKTMDGRPLPALTTMLYGVCDGDHTRLTEAMRLLELFLARDRAEHNRRTAELHAYCNLQMELRRRAEARARELTEFLLLCRPPTKDERLALMYGGTPSTARGD